MHSIQFLGQLSTTKRLSDIIFPLKVKPKNDDPNHDFYWGFELPEYHKPTIYNVKRHDPAFGNRRNKGARTHAARDLYTNALTEVVAIANGNILSVSSFYAGTHQVTILHTTQSKGQFIIRYGELDPNSITVKEGMQIEQGQSLGKTGKLNGISQYMLHFEYYTGESGLDFKIALTHAGKVDNSRRTLFNGAKFERRADIADPIKILKDGYHNTFMLQDDSNSRSDNRVISSKLTISQKGKIFIQKHEGLRLDPYNDSKGFCTVGYGHLIARQACNTIPDLSIKLNLNDNGEITLLQANAFFDKDIIASIEAVRALDIELFQYEFDALASLLFNTGPYFLSNNKAPKLLQNLKDGNYEEAANEFLDITNGNTTGLVNRRKEEYNMFLHGIY